MEVNLPYNQLKQACKLEIEPGEQIVAAERERMNKF